jgi:phenylacetate-coenzyme A ligase PaaK-like adenylate-forming protein
MHDYELLRRRHMADAMALAPQMIERLDWSADRLAAHRRQQLRAIVAHAMVRSPWHRERLDGVDLMRLDEDTLRELPPMSKGDLMGNFDRIVTDPRLTLPRVNAHLETVQQNGYLFDRYTALTSGGSSGERGVFLYDWDGWATFWLGTFRYLLRAKQADPELAGRPLKIAWVMAGHFTHATAALGRTFANPNVISYRFPVTLPIEEIVDGLNQVQPDFVNAYPSALHLLSFEAQAGRLRISPRRVQSAAEPLLPEIRAAAEAAWGVRVGNLYGASEGGGVATPCDERRTHLSEDLMILEPVDADGRPVAPGKPAAKVYLTNLYNRTLPLIRYELTDEVTILRESCPCGSAHRCVADIQGRMDDTFFYEGRPVHPHVFRTALGRRGRIVEYQVRQTPAGADITVRCQGRVDLDGLAREIEGELLRLGLEAPEVTVRAAARLERTRGPAKLRRFVPLTIEPAYASAGSSSATSLPLG